ncbi:mannan endo-1,4-beta-mannosidase 7-like [Chenopodium quinoa]|uniref:mannan endo-1,4-beta-mannosidase 7-like n=1 Tax=Chenopodium quinoa TaxID=63459 RepID=UPI000B76E755|nr:mannan endo-1,4-beta-mannosidase 7-like [Chenopodium quinoa]
MKAWGLILLVFLLNIQEKPVKAEDGFITTKGVQFWLNGIPFYSNGFNAYWLMYEGSDPSQRHKVSGVFQQASNHGLSIVRTWAFSDAGYRPLQYSPGSYNQQMFQGLDFVLAEAKKYGIKVVLSLVNNYDEYGGKKQYVEWAKSKGQSLSSKDDFFTNPVVKGFYKNHIKTVLTRVNSITGVAYKDDTTIMAWELMNEPRCPSDPSGKVLQDWISEMASYLKSIDANHLLEVGLEGFYGDDKKQYNPNTGKEGTNFIANNQVPGVDFATVHSYPDQWLNGSTGEAQLSFHQQWVQQHIMDSLNILKKPVIFAEFGKSYKVSGYTPSDRNQLYNITYASIYSSASRGGPAAGGLFWHLLTKGMDNFRDGYEIVFEEESYIAGIISEQSQKLSGLRKKYAQLRDTEKNKY